MNHVILIATNYHYIQLALNNCLSVKAADKKVKVGLIYCPEEARELSGLIDRYFDEKYPIKNTFQSNAECAFYYKVRLYDIAVSMFSTADSFLYLDADTMMLPNRKVSDWFDEHSDKIFTAYCNDIYDFETQKRTRNDYTFWCNIDYARNYWRDHFKNHTVPNCNKIPQINSSFIYFKKRNEIKRYFEIAATVWDDSQMEYTEYRNTKPDELCFNVASMVTGILPHRTTYRPVYFECFSGGKGLPYTLHQFAALGFAGTQVPSEWLIHFYNKLSNYYREINGIALRYEYRYQPEKPNTYLTVAPLYRRTLYRKGELPNSEGGVFNPSCITHNGTIITTYRKEIGIENGRYVGSSALMHVEKNTNGYIEHTELSFALGRNEDFRLFKYGNNVYVSHSFVKQNTFTNLHCCISLSKIIDEGLVNYGVVNLPLVTKKSEKNWVFFGKNKLYCIYSLKPYLLFSTEDMATWKEEPVTSKNFKWIDKEFICNSTNPVLINDQYLMFFHTKSEGRYRHGAVLIDAKTKEITHATPKEFYLPFNNEGYAKGILYVSGVNVTENHITVYAGECDTNSVYYVFDKNQLLNQIKKYPC